MTISLGLGRSSTVEKAGRSSLVKPLVVLNFLAVFLVLPLIALVPVGDRLIVVTAPWHDDRAAAVILRAGGTLLTGEMGGRDWMAVGHSDDGGFGGRLIASGALLVLSGGFVDGCLSQVGGRANGRLGINSP